MIRCPGGGTERHVLDADEWRVTGRASGPGPADGPLQQRRKLTAGGGSVVELYQPVRLRGEPCKGAPGERGQRPPRSVGTAVKIRR